MERLESRIFRCVSVIGEAWCRAMHDDISWPRNGHYHCHSCGRIYRVPWEQPLVYRGPSLQPVAATGELRRVHPAAA